MKGWKNASKQPVKNRNLWERLDKPCGTYKIARRWVKCHNGHLENERADALVNCGFDELGEGRCDK